ncbi:unnamed protein product [Onchocerca flexuosa]|uniref:Transmembrane protein n=1 Tax=Onchocerca flexuosa TaxID=387005 RepID=A0A183H6D3_9BILA|nr:unnamed protein product [Onchocerca flexuosa]
MIQTDFELQQNSSFLARELVGKSTVLVGRLPLILLSWFFSMWGLVLLSSFHGIFGCSIGDSWWSLGVNWYSCTSLLSIRKMVIA